MFDRSTFRRSAAAVAGMALVTIAAPGLAADTAGPATVSATAPAAVAKPDQKAQPRPGQIYCIVDTITGSRIPKRECHTKADWEARGVKLPIK